MRHAAVLTVALLLAACSVLPGVQPVADQTRIQAEGAMDDLVDFNIWQLCYGFSVGSIRREFGINPERAALYYALCSTPGPVVTPLREPDLGS